MSVTVLGTVIVSKAVHPLKAFIPISVSVDESGLILTVFNPVQSWNAPIPLVELGPAIFVTLLGIVISVNFSHLEKAPYPIVATWFPIVTFSKFVQL